MTFSSFIKLLFVLLGTFVLHTGCAHQKPIQNTQNSNWISNPNWLGKPLPFAPFDSLRTQIESLEKIQLKHRGEAHITVITPPEYEKIKEAVSIQDLEKKFSYAILKAQWQPLCVGKFQKENKTTYFVVVRSAELKEIRKQIKELATQSDFQPEEFYPHITLGFTDRDLHSQDGAIKDERACVYPLTELNFSI
jgi:2'-5' RNA ligase